MKRPRNIKAKRKGQKLITIRSSKVKKKSDQEFELRSFRLWG